MVLVLRWMSLIKAACFWTTLGVHERIEQFDRADYSTTDIQSTSLVKLLRETGELCEDHCWDDHESRNVRVMFQPKNQKKNKKINVAFLAIFFLITVMQKKKLKKNVV